MKRLLFLFLLLAPVGALAADKEILDYGMAETIDVCLYNADGSPHSSASLTTGDIKISIDGATATNIDTGNLVAEAPCYELSLSAANLTGRKITVTIVDVGGTDWIAKVIKIYTRNNPNAFYPEDSGTTRRD